MSVISFLQFLQLLFKRGRLHHSGYDFHKTRNNLLSDIIIRHGVEDDGNTLKHWMMKNPALRTLTSEAAFIKRSIRPRARHITTGDGKLCYIRIPRAASTSISRAILRTRYPDLSIDSLSEAQVNALTDVCLETSGRIDTCSDIVAVVRNPFSRIVSVYRTFFENKTGHFLYEDYLAGILTRDLSFPDFVDIVRLIPDALRDQHFQTQHRLMAFYQRKSVKVMKLETKEWKEFLSARGLNCAEEDADSFKNHESYYDRETLEKVRGIYASDIREFGYESAYEKIRFNVEQRPVRL